MTTASPVTDKQRKLATTEDMNRCGRDEATVLKGKLTSMAIVVVVVIVV
jgi:hypothetical protein